MSQSATESGAQSHEYLRGWKALYDLAREGRSFSGRERHCIFWNVPDAPFADASAVTGLDLPDDGRGLALSDWDGDGDLDLWISSRSGPRVRYFENRVPSEAAWIAFRLTGTRANRDAIGARVRVMNLASRAVVVGTVTEDGTVRVGR